MNSPSFDRDGWEQRWQQVMASHADMLATKAPNPYVTGELEELFTTRRPDSEPSVLDAGAGHGAEALWLAAHGWNVTAVDFSPAALDFGQRNAAQAGADVAERITWVEGDLGVWAPEPRAHDVVLCLYVHCAGDMAEMITRLASGVAPGGTLFMVGHQSVDPATGEPTRAAGQHQVSIDEAVAALRGDEWEIVTLENRRRDDQMGGVDAVVRAVRQP